MKKYYYNVFVNEKLCSSEYDTFKSLMCDFSRNGGKKNLKGFITKVIDNTEYVRCYDSDHKKYIWVKD